MRVNLGCGTKVKEGWVNCDIVKRKGVDLVFDLNKKWDLEDESVDELECRMVIEHIHDLNNFVCELKRVLKIKGSFVVSTQNFFFWRERLKFLFGSFVGSKAFHIDHCWLFKPSSLADFFRLHGLYVEIKGKGLVNYPDLFYSYFELRGYKRSEGEKGVGLDV